MYPFTFIHELIIYSKYTMAKLPESENRKPSEIRISRLQKLSEVLSNCNFCKTSENKISQCVLVVKKFYSFVIKCISKRAFSLSFLSQARWLVIFQSNKDEFRKEINICPILLLNKISYSFPSGRFLETCVADKWPRVLMKFVDMRWYFFY